MPQLNVIVRATKKGNNAEIMVRHIDSKKTLTRRVLWSKIDTPDKFASWLLMQDFNQLGEVATELEHQFSINFVNVTEEDEFGEEYTYRQLVNVDSSPTPRKDLIAWIDANIASVPAIQQEFFSKLKLYLENV